MFKVCLPCETVSKNFLPLFRSLVAKELIEQHNFTQIEAAESLGTTQAAISQYIHSKRGYKNLEKFGDVLTLIQNKANVTAKEIVTKKSNSYEVMSNFCEICPSVRNKIKTE